MPKRRIPAASKSVTSKTQKESVLAQVEAPTWTFLSNHAHVLVALTRFPNHSMREISLLVGITERSVQRIVTDLEGGGYLRKEKLGRVNQYSIRTGLPLRHPLERHCDVGELLALIASASS